MVAECKAEDSEETLEAAGRRGDGEDGDAAKKTEGRTQLRIADFGLRI